jgi:hypothetical protein
LEVANAEGAKVPWPPFVAPTLGLQNLSVPELLQRLADDLPLPRSDPGTGSAGRVLDSGIEAQVHGPIDIQRDVELLVADPSFSGAPTGDHLKELSRKYGIPLHWHVGFRLAAREVPEAFRGPGVRMLAQRIAVNGMIDAAVIGSAAQSRRLHPEEWRDWGAEEDTLQQLKQLWHVLVHYGRAAERDS